LVAAAVVCRAFSTYQVLFRAHQSHLNHGVDSSGEGGSPAVEMRDLILTEVAHQVGEAARHDDLTLVIAK
jgi:hypothetical protein